MFCQLLVGSSSCEPFGTVMRNVNCIKSCLISYLIHDYISSRSCAEGIYFNLELKLLFLVEPSLCTFPWRFDVLLVIKCLGSTFQKGALVIRVGLLLGELTYESRLLFVYITQCTVNCTP